MLARLSWAIGLVLLSCLALISGAQAQVAIRKWGEYYDAVTDDPVRFGLVNTKNLCAGRAVFGEDPAPCSTPDRYFCYHDGHSSTAVHRIAAQPMEREFTEVFR